MNKNISIKVVQFFLAIRTGRSRPARKLAPEKKIDWYFRLARSSPVTMALAERLPIGSRNSF